MKARYKYRLIPFLGLQFFRAASSFGISLAIPLYYNGKLDGGLIGFLTAATALSYLFSPFLFRNAYKKIGIKNSLLIATLGMLVVQIGLQFSLECWGLTYAFLFLDGLFLGLFWPIIASAHTSLLTKDHIRDDEKKKRALDKLYGLSWNLGGIFGYSICAILLFFLSDLLLVFDLSLIYSISMVVLAIIFENINGVNPQDLLMDETLSKNNLKQLIIPMTVFFSLMFLFAFLSGSFGILYPIKLNNLNYPDYVSYLLNFVRTLVQTITIYLVMSLSIKTLRKSIPPVILIMISIFSIFGLIDNFLIYVIILALFGMSLAILYSYGFKLSILKNIQNKNMKGTTFFESASGFGFWLGPIFAGFLANLPNFSGFIVMSFFTGLFALVYLINSKKLKST
ncbi:MAG: MFS transporter [Candidatus Lokiarchaeota archaeon]|nr:MFS transporter [Candidatus Lokiarchaeota archaeon]